MSLKYMASLGNFQKWISLAFVYIFRCYLSKSVFIPTMIKENNLSQNIYLISVHELNWILLGFLSVGWSKKGIAL